MSIMNNDFQFTRAQNEGRRLLRLNQLNKSLKCLTAALALRPQNLECLINRSIAYLSLGQISLALKDVDSALKLDPENTTVWKQKADVHFANSEFEKSLLLYHNCLKVNPTNWNFMSGVYRAQTAILNCVGENSFLASLPPKLTGNVVTKLYKENAEEEKKSSAHPKLDFLHELSKDREYVTDLIKGERKRVDSYHDMYKPFNPAVEKQMFRRNYRNHPTIINYVHGFQSVKILAKAESLMDYLIPRNDFWRSSTPYHVRKGRATPVVVDLLLTDDLSSASWNIQEIVLEMVRAEMYQFQHNYQRVIEISKNLLEHLEEVLPGDKQYSPGITSDLYSTIGCSYMELGMYTEALQYFEMDFELGVKHQLTESRNRALDYIGIVSFRSKNYDRAIEVWSERLDFVKGILEQCWLYHEIGRAHLANGDHMLALDFAGQAVDKSIEGMDERWKLNATVLTAKVHEDMHDQTQAIKEYEKAIDICKEIKMDEAVEDFTRHIENLIRLRKEAAYSSRSRESMRYNRLSRKLSCMFTEHSTGHQSASIASSLQLKSLQMSFNKQYN